MVARINGNADISLIFTNQDQVSALALMSVPFSYSTTIVGVDFSPPRRCVRLIFPCSRVTNTSEQSHIAHADSESRPTTSRSLAHIIRDNQRSPRHLCSTSNNLHRINGPGRTALARSLLPELAFEIRSSIRETVG